MAAPTNTFSSYDAVGIKEDLSEIITMVSPEETPFYSKSKKTKATNTYHEWQTDALRASQANAHAEGDNTVADSRQSTVRLGNYTQILKGAVAIPDTDEGLTKAGRAKEIGYQVLKLAKEIKLDTEKALFDNNARVAGNSSTPREMAGLPSWLVTNVSSGTGGAVATGDGTNAYTDGTQEAFTQARFDGVMQSIWEQGGRPNSVYLSAFQMNAALGFVGNNSQRSTIGAADGKVANLLSIYMTPWGSVEFVPVREARSRDVFILQDDMFEVAVLRGMKNTALAKTGDATTRQVVQELTLVCKNEKSSGMIADNTTS